MRARGIAKLYVHSVTVAPYKGAGSAGDVFLPAVTLDPATGNGCLIEDGSHLVRNKDGEEVVSMGIIYCDVANEPSFVVNSLVTTPTRSARVITVSTNSAPGLNLPDHLEVHLT